MTWLISVYEIAGETRDNKIAGRMNLILALVLGDGKCNRYGNELECLLSNCKTLKPLDVNEQQSGNETMNMDKNLYIPPALLLTDSCRLLSGLQIWSSFLVF